MRITRGMGLVATLALVVALPAAAQYGFGGGAMVPPAFRGVLSPVVGSGAAYQVTTDSGKTVKNEVEILTVGKEGIAGKDGYWLEIGMNNPNMGQIYMKMLIGIDEGQKRISTARMIMQMAGQPPMEMPSQMLNMQRTAPQSTDVREDARLVGTEDVTTPAGTFSCQHYKSKDGKGDFWLSSKVSPWGLVKATGEGDDMILTRTITGASDHITGTPVPFNPAAFAGAGRRGQ